MNNRKAWNVQVKHGCPGYYLNPDSCFPNKNKYVSGLSGCPGYFCKLMRRTTQLYFRTHGG
jgi:hypothetical protein